MTTFEVELEQEKTEKIAQVAARGASIAAQLGQRPQAVSIFLSHYFRHVDAMDVDERSVDDLLGLVESHYRLAMHRPAARATVAIRSPSQSQDGWTAGGATVVQDPAQATVSSMPTRVMEVVEVDAVPASVGHRTGAYDRPQPAVGSSGPRGPVIRPGRGSEQRATTHPSAHRSPPHRPKAQDPP